MKIGNIDVTKEISDILTVMENSYWEKIHAMVDQERGPDRQNPKLMEFFRGLQEIAIEEIEEVIQLCLEEQRKVMP